jgi:hypothetical protein
MSSSSISEKGIIHNINLTFIKKGRTYRLEEALASIKSELLGHSLLEELIKQGIHTLSCEIDWKIGEKITKLNFHLIITKELLNELLPKSFSELSSRDNIYIYIKNINANNTNNNRPQSSCLWLISNPTYNITYLGKNETNIIYLGYIRSEGKNCFRVLAGEDKKVPQGLLLMNIMIEISKLLKFNGISLLDYAAKSCLITKANNTSEEQKRGLKNVYLLTTGNTYYGNFGFKPIVKEYSDQYDQINNLFNKNISELFKDVDLQAILNAINEKIKATGKDKYFNLMKIYLERLMAEIKQNPLELFYTFNSRIIKSNCANEKIIIDIIEDHDFIKDRTTETYIKSLRTGNFEKMYLQLKKPDQNGGTKLSNLKNKKSKINRRNRRNKSTKIKVKI